MQIQPYLHAFNGRCEEAINFYQRVLSAEVVMMMRQKDHPEPCGEGMSPEFADKIMHASLRIGDSVLMLSDGDCKNLAEQFHGFSLSLNPPDVATGERLFAALAEGGEIRMPLGKTFWSPGFGIVTDRFGVAWMINVGL